MSWWQRHGIIGQMTLINANRRVQSRETKKERNRERVRRINKCNPVTKLLFELTQIEGEAQNADYGETGTFIFCCIQGHLLSFQQNLAHSQLDQN